MANIQELCTKALPRVIRYRRNLHKYPEAPLTEYRTACVVIERLRELGYDVLFGDDAMDLTNIQTLLPDIETAEAAYARALSEGADPVLLQRMQYHKTGVVGILCCGEGPVVGIRCDMDAVRVTESDDPDRIPCKEGFRSVHDGIHHGCGHDAHTSIGLGVAEVMAQLKAEGKLHGTLKLFFEPAEEFLAGGRAMTDRGVADDLTRMIGVHLAIDTTKTGQFAASATEFPTQIKYDVAYNGKVGHSGYAPEQGKNALLAAAVATVCLMGISRHSKGNTRVNVNSLHSGVKGNNCSVPGKAEMMVELRAFSDEVLEYIVDRARTILKFAGDMYECETVITENTQCGAAISAVCDPEMVEILRKAAESVPEITEFIPQASMRGAGEDATQFILKAQKNGGYGTYVMFGSDLSNAAHTPGYDVDERVLNIALKTLTFALADMMA